MNNQLIKEKLFEQRKVYETFKNGDRSNVQYKECYDNEFGTMDENYLNRTRLSHYLLYAHIDDEETVAFLYEEEIKDRINNSYQGIGDALTVLTFILKNYSSSGKFDEMFEKAQNSNFDCACGFDEDFPINDNLESLDLIECIYLCEELEYDDVMEVLVNQWKEAIIEWTDKDRNTLIHFNSYLGKEAENEPIRKTLLDNAIKSGITFNIVFEYNKLIRYYIDIKEYETAYSYLHKMIDTTDFDQIKEIHLFGDVLEESFEIIYSDGHSYIKLWEWAKSYLRKKKNMYGDLYTKSIAAAKAVNSSYVNKLEQEYENWKIKMG